MLRQYPKRHNKNELHRLFGQDEFRSRDNWLLRVFKITEESVDNQ
jgi:hypothetical protein